MFGPGQERLASETLTAVAAPLRETLAWEPCGSLDAADHRPRMRVTDQVALAFEEYKRSSLSHIAVGYTHVVLEVASDG